METKTELIYDEGEIRYCDYNITRMSLFQYWWQFDKGDIIKSVFTSFIHGLKGLRDSFLIPLSILMLFLYPLLAFIRALMDKRRAIKRGEE